LWPSFETHAGGARVLLRTRAEFVEANCGSNNHGPHPEERGPARGQASRRMAARIDDLFHIDDVS
jgi:hypothetical protein